MNGMSTGDMGAPYTPAESHIARIFDRLNQRIGAIIMSQADETAKQINDQLTKAKGEIDTLVSTLEGTSVDPATLDQLKSTAQALDDIVPDQVVAAPADGETPA